MLLPITFAVISALLPVISQKTGLSDKYGLKMKMLCAFMYLLTGVFSVAVLHSTTAYSFMILSALSLGALGDFFLGYKNNRYFSAGVVFFALGHIVYGITFLCFGNYAARHHMGFVFTGAAALSFLSLAFARLKLNLSGKKKLLLLYVPILIFAFVCAFTCGIISINSGNIYFALCLMAGGVLFLASDIMIGVEKGGIKRPEFLHNAVSYTYFTAQALFALSILFQ